MSFRPGQPNAGGSISFDGSGDYIDLGTPAVLNALTAFTHVFDIFTKQSSNGIMTIFISNFTGSNGFEIRWSSGNQFTIVKNGATVLSNDTNNPMPTKEWVRCVVSLDSATGNIILAANGRVLINGNCGVQAFTHADNRIGMKTGDLLAYLANYQIFPFAATVEQIEDDYMRNVRMGKPALELFMDSPRGSDTTVTDSSGNGINGTLNGCTISRFSPVGKEPQRA